MKHFSKNPPDWYNDEIKIEIKKFVDIFKNRPIKKNIHGMRFLHMFCTYFILKKIKPSYVIESGVYKGQSTWLIEQTLPECNILSIDINLDQREYISKKATYSNIDFKHQNFQNIPDDTLVFFDDHVSHYERLQQSKFFNIKNIILEDNYDVGKGDFYSIKHAYENSGFNHNYTKWSLLKTLLVFMGEIFKKFLNKNYIFDLEKIKFRLRDRKVNLNDFKNINKNIDIYYEFPNVYDLIDKNLDVPRDELNAFNNITYIKLI
tara:strand:+ start:495 stop:1280 length:786 start_codon:yes stop_codon:yes gene_type:complete